MKNSPESDCRIPARAGGVVRRAPAGARNDAVWASLTSGFGAVLEKEHELQSATESSFASTTGQRSADLDRILHLQHSRLGANIALLEQRFAALPKPERFASWHERSRPASKPPAPGHETKRLPDLVGQHTRLLADLDALIGCAPGGQQGEHILAEVSRSHEEMAWMLTALLKEDESVRRMANERHSERRGESVCAQENWDNEGGPVRKEPPTAEVPVEPKVRLE